MIKLTSPSLEVAEAALDYAVRAESNARDDLNIATEDLAIKEHETNLARDAYHVAYRTHEVQMAKNSEPDLADELPPAQMIILGDFVSTRLCDILQEDEDYKFSSRELVSRIWKFLLDKNLIHTEGQLNGQDDF